MKNVMTFVSPDEAFNEESKTLVKLQIDNSLDLGWNKDDIILITNFPYEYSGVKATIVGDHVFCRFHPPATKIFALAELMEMGIDDLIWYHDFDCYQFNPIRNVHEELNGYDFGITNYNRMPRLCSASMFLKPSASDIVEELKYSIIKNRINEEECLMRLINENITTFGKRVKKLNITYALHLFNFAHSYNRADKPIVASHWHPTKDKIDFFIHGKNKLNKVVVPERLIKIFYCYGYR